MPTYSHTQLLFLCFILAILCQVAVGNDTIVSPEHIEGSTIVAAEGLIETCTQIPGLVLPDSGITAAHKEGFIEGSVSLPDIETGCNSQANCPLPHYTVLFYCNGIKCDHSALRQHMSAATLPDRAGRL